MGRGCRSGGFDVGYSLTLARSQHDVELRLET
jgi:hypothetical protein